MVNHVPVLVSEGLTGGLIVRPVGNYAGRLHLLENAVFSSQVLISIRAWSLSSNFIADDDTSGKN